MENNQLCLSQNEQDNLFSEDDEDQSSQIIEYDPSNRFCKYNEEIGKGAYKSVFRGYDNQSGCEVAWNVFQLNSVPQNERRRARQEISILSSLKHNNVINFIHSWHNKKKKEIVFITEIINGGSLKNYMRRITRPKLKVIKNWCRQILLGLEYLHKQNIIHRDLKCENILIDTNNNELKIGDLGLSIQLQQSFTSSVLGTPEFMAPEIYQEHYDMKVDIYAFGMCMLEMVTGMKPFCECKGGTGQVIKRVIEMQKPQTIEAILHEKIKSIILECLKSPEERPSATQLLEQHFNQSSADNDNSAVQLNEQLMLQLSGDSKNSSFLKCNLSNKMMQTNSSINKGVVKISNQSNYSKYETNSEVSTQKQPEQKFEIKKKNLTIETDDDQEQNFLKYYKEYLVKLQIIDQNTKTDETLLDLEQRQDKELQTLKQLHLIQQQEYQKKISCSNQTKPIQQPNGSGFLSPGSLHSFFGLQHDFNYLRQIAESPILEKDNSKRLIKPKMIPIMDLNCIKAGENCPEPQLTLSQSSQACIEFIAIIDKVIDVNF